MKNFFTDLWAKVKSDFINATALLGTVCGSIMDHIDEIATALGDPALNDQIHTFITDAKWFGRWMMVVGILAMVARFKKLVESPK
jgi:hypothetical protein